MNDDSHVLLFPKRIWSCCCISARTLQGLSKTASFGSTQMSVSQSDLTHIRKFRTKQAILDLTVMIGPWSERTKGTYLETTFLKFAVAY